VEKQEAKMGLWNPTEHSDQENLTWCHLRAIEWCAWPVFVSQPIIPLLFLFWSPFTIIMFLIIANIIWALVVRDKIVVPSLAYLAVYFVKLKWLTIPITLVVLIQRGDYILVVISLLWPILSGIVGYFPGRLVGKTQKMFMSDMGYNYQDPLGKATEI
jgi:hypothetical protein